MQHYVPSFIISIYKTKKICQMSIIQLFNYTISAQNLNNITPLFTFCLHLFCPVKTLYYQNYFQFMQKINKRLLLLVICHSKVYHHSVARRARSLSLRLKICVVHNIAYLGRHRLSVLVKETAVGYHFVFRSVVGP